MGQNTIEDKIVDILEIAIYAPSVHNTQPWRVHAEGNTILIKIDPEHKLADGDPTGRQTAISLGIFCEAIIIASKQFGFKLVSINNENIGAALVFTPSRHIKPNASEIEALQSRVTDRSIYAHTDLSLVDVRSIINSSKGLRAKVWVLTDAKDIDRVATLTAKGISVAMSNPSFRRELSQYLIVPWSSKRRGISTSSLYIPKIMAAFEPVFMRLGVGLKTEARLEKRRWLSASGIVLITTTGDMPEHWITAGRAYMRVALKIEELGYSQATSAATVEASNYHEDVEEMAQTNQRLQSVLRIGKGAKIRTHSPRVKVSELLT